MQHRKKPANKTVRQATGAIRIISGQWRGRKLPVLDAEGLRPTTDRTKETLFNWLMNDVAGRRCVDVFAGSGGLGFEALSRGASQVTFVELDKSAFQIIGNNLRTLKVDDAMAQVFNTDALAFLKSCSAESIDLLFLDPPFGKGLVEKVLNLVWEKQLIAADGLIYVEMEQGAVMPTLPEQWQELKLKETKQFSYRLIHKCV
ncbi:16S rRNA (guanine(966)-N(2))-methyltransferase RsmD [Paraneptunicella aestuarii]|uniref:16S rRNA (guanine(966)-N(2))-methyltransferase RsmD n=1 Tax=Paraneptunicella aestuarii TaxID=2831148 RepID=UPI001E4A59C5|nr:16S rRNA (guanine(966)-N(2))-methyltransferase RsmD [Paraneptunicella aestuarii]UAA38527.1 16S rRNA (guanine(966)-N(2))-methyltransferase RsmD [Paraneptunicella aestuarii]